MTWHADVAVIGAGAAGCVAAAAAARSGARVIVVDGGAGATALSSGTVDVADPGASSLDPLDAGAPLASAVEELARHEPQHPYSRIGAAGRAQLPAALGLLRELAADVDLVGAATPEAAMVVATALGTVKATALAQHTIAGGHLERLTGARVGVAHFGRIGLFDGRASVATLRLAVNGSAPERRFESFPLEIRFLRRGRDARSGVFELARLFDSDEMVDGLARATQATLRVSSRLQHLLLPPLIGLQRPCAALQKLEQALGLPVSEVCALPPSVPGWRLARALVRGLADHGVEVIRGRAVGASIGDGEVRGVDVVEAGGKTMRALRARRIVLASGHLVGGGIRADRRLMEPLLGLPLTLDGVPVADASERWLAPDYLQTQPVLRAGVAVNGELRPLDGRHPQPVLRNVHVAGSLIAGNDPASHKAGIGLCALTGWLAGRAAVAD
ncbi:MAG: FAD-binding protein [Deltaproteobacteria bacterium]|nr:FAD-binding protein [Deltaproteobacteria bacterium]